VRAQWRPGSTPSRRHLRALHLHRSCSTCRSCASRGQRLPQYPATAPRCAAGGMRQAGSNQHQARPECAPLRSALCRQTHGLSRHRPPMQRCCTAALQRLPPLQRRHTASLQRLLLCSVLLLCSAALMLLCSGRTAPPGQQSPDATLCPQGLPWLLPDTGIAGEALVVPGGGKARATRATATTFLLRLAAPRETSRSINPPPRRDTIGREAPRKKTARKAPQRTGHTLRLSTGHPGAADGASSCINGVRNFTLALLTRIGAENACF
jgi:hypothetical protein